MIRALDGMNFDPVIDVEYPFVEVTEAFQFRERPCILARYVSRIR